MSSTSEGGDSGATNADSVGSDSDGPEGASADTSTEDVSTSESERIDPAEKEREDDSKSPGSTGQEDQTQTPSAEDGNTPQGQRDEKPRGILIQIGSIEWYLGLERSSSKVPRSQWIQLRLFCLELFFGKTQPTSSPSASASAKLKSADAIRRRSGVGFSLIGVIGVASFLGFALYAVPELLSLPEVAGLAEEYDAEFNRQLLYYSAIILALKAVLTVSAIYFGYQLLRVAERLFIPYQAADDLRDLLGLDPPDTAASGFAAELGDKIIAKLDTVMDLFRKSDRPSGE